MRKELAKTIKLYEEGYNRYDSGEWKRDLLWYIENALLHWNPDPVAVLVIMDFVKKKHAELDKLDVPYKKDSEYKPPQMLCVDIKRKTDWANAN